MKELNQTTLKDIWSSATSVLKKYFNVMPDKENEDDTIKTSVPVYRFTEPHYGY